MKVKEIAEFLAAPFYGDGDVVIERVASIDQADEGELAFVEQGPPPNAAASCIIAAEHDGTSAHSVIVSPNPKLAFARVAAILQPQKANETGIHPSAVVAESAALANDVYIGPHATVGENSTIGEGTQIGSGSRIGNNVSVGHNTVIHPNVCIEDGCSVGDRVILHAGVVIGADGFGFVRDEEGRYHKFPQIGTVVIEDDVEIGANTCVDRGALGETRIGEGTKIDNLVQVGHNVSVGNRCVIAAQTGISGSVVIEDDCVIGGQVGFGDHVRVQSGAVIGSQAGILPGKIVRPGVWWGTPIQPLEEFKRQNAHVKGIERLKERVKKLEGRD